MLKFILDIVKFNYHIAFVKVMLSTLIISFMGYYAYYTIEDSPRMPAPTEFVEKKKKRKEFKKYRKAFYEYMHKADLNADWRAIDKKTRKEKTNQSRIFLESMLEEGQLSRPNLSRVAISSRDLQGEWAERGSNNLAGRIRTADIDFENNLIYCASSGGNIWRGTLEGENWTSLTDYQQVLGITFLRKINNRILFSNNKGFYYSDNEGLILNQSQGLEFLDNSSWSNIKRTIIKAETNEIYCLIKESNNGAVTSIYKSEDLGQSFFRVLSFNSNSGFAQEDISHFDIWTSRYFETDIYILNDDSIYKLNQEDVLSYVGQVHSGNYSGDVILTGGMGTSVPFLYAYVNGQIFQSVNGGDSWVNRGSSPIDWYFTINSFNSSNVNQGDIYIGGVETFRSSNGGNNWTLVNNWWDYYDNPSSKLHADIPEIRFFLDEEYNEVALISTDGGIYMSDDGIMSVENLSLFGLGVSQYYSTYTKRNEPYHIYAGSQDQGFQRSLQDNDGIRLFEQSISGDYGHLVSGDGGETLWCNYPGFTMYYNNPETDAWGLTLDFPGSGHLWLAPLMADPLNPEVAYLGGGGLNGGNHIMKLTVQGNNISYEELSQSFPGTVSAMAISPLDYSYWYVLTDNGKFYHSSDSGQTWSNNQWFTGPNAHYFYGSSILPSPVELGKVYISGSGYSNPAVYVSNNHGVSFQSLMNGLPNTLVFDLDCTEDGNFIFAATEVGPYVYSVSDGEWHDLAGVGAPDQTYWTVEYIAGIQTVRYGTYGRGIWDFILDDNFDIVYGDINDDNYINIQDIVLLIQFILNTIEPSNTQFIAADINVDAYLNVSDIILIMNIILEN